MEYSCLKTLAGKHESTSRKMMRKYRDGNGSWGVPYQTKAGIKAPQLRKVYGLQKYRPLDR